jgi:hypothetical protein
MLGTNSVIPTVGLALGLPRPDKSGLAMTPFVFVITRHASAEAISGRGNEIATLPATPLARSFGSPQ